MYSTDPGAMHARIVLRPAASPEAYRRGGETPAPGAGWWVLTLVGDIYSEADGVVCDSEHRLPRRGVLGGYEVVDFGRGRPAGSPSTRSVRRDAETAAVEEVAAEQTPPAAAAGALVEVTAGAAEAPRTGGMDAPHAGEGHSWRVIASSWLCGAASRPLEASGSWAARGEFLVGALDDGGSIAARVAASAEDALAAGEAEVDARIGAPSGGASAQVVP